MQPKICPINNYKVSKLEQFEDGDFLIDNSTGDIYERNLSCAMSEDGIVYFVMDGAEIATFNLDESMTIKRGSILVKKQVRLINKSTGQYKNVIRLFSADTNEPVNAKNTEQKFAKNVYWCPISSNVEAKTYSKPVMTSFKMGV